MQSINPSTDQVIKEYKEHTLKESKEAIKETASSFEYWKKLSFSERAELFKKAAQILRNKKTQFAELMATEMGKPITQGESEIEKCAWCCEFYADNAENFLKEELIATDASKSYVRFEPLGTILAIMPWNFPFWQVFRFAAPSLMAGNVAVLKHSSNVPGCALEIEKIFIEAGFPDNVFRTLLISGSTADKLIAYKHIKAVTLTGSSAAGKTIAAKAGKHLKKTVLELGGSDPFIVLEDADIKAAAQGAKISRTLNTGQSCISAKRFIVMEYIADQFEREFKELLENMKVGDPLNKETEIGPLAREDLLLTLDKQVKDSVQKGAVVLTGGKRLDKEGFFYAPTLLSKVTKGMPVYEEETFGPVAAIIRVKNDKMAVKVANDTIYGLGASIWTSNIERGELLSKQIEAGAAFINGFVKSDPRLPFGGVKQSGYGRELGSYGIKEFVNIKTVWVK